MSVGSRCFCARPTHVTTRLVILFTRRSNRFLTLWYSAGASINPLVKGLAGFDKDERGKLRTDAGLRAKGPAAAGAVYVVGDDAAVQGTETELGA